VENVFDIELVRRCVGEIKYDSVLFMPTCMIKSF
jgi:hypothetical protein